MRYYEVIKENLSICLDSDIGYYYEFHIGDIICISDDFNIFREDSKLERVIRKSNIYKPNYIFTYLVVNCYEVLNDRLYIHQCVDGEYLRELDKTFVVSSLRDLRIDEIGL